MNIVPVWGRVVVRPFNVEETDETFKNSQIIIPKETKDKEQRAQMEGELVCVGGNAFEDWVGQKPVPGDTVLFDKYVGFHKKVNGEIYRMINDSDIVAILED